MARAKQRLRQRLGLGKDPVLANLVLSAQGQLQAPDVSLKTSGYVAVELS